MADAAFIALLLVCIPLVGWSTLHGLLTGTMDAAGVPYASYSRSKSPILFWFATTFNIFLLVVGSAFLLNGIV